jgi:periplasmic divalent cation tolerance protein
MISSNGLLQVVTTCATREEAVRIADVLVADRLAACVQIHAPIASVYRWQEQVEHAEEWLVAIKTTQEQFTAVSDAIRRNHSYSVPQIIALPIVDGSQDYVAWLREQLGGNDE